MRSIAILLAVIAVAVAQGPIIYNVTQLTLNTPFVTAVGPQFNSTYYGIPSQFYAYLPPTTRSINISIVVPSTTACYGLYTYIGGETFPCYTNSPFSASGINFACAASTYYVGSSTTAEQYYPGDYSGSVGDIGYQFTAGGYMYISTTKTYSSDYNETCPFTITLSAAYCADGEVAVGDGTASGVTCVSYTNVTLAGNNSAVTFPFTTSAGGVAVYKFTLPDGIASLTLSAQSNASFYLYGLNKQVIENNYISGGCYFSSSSNAAGGTCTGMQAGTYYVHIYSSSVSAGNVSFSSLVCSGTQVGPYCNSTYINVTEAFLTGSTAFTYTTSAYGCGVLPSFPQNNFYNVYFVGNSTYPDLFFGRGGFPKSSYESADVNEAIGYSYYDIAGPYDSQLVCFYADPCSSGSVCAMYLYVNQTQFGPSSTSSGNTGATTGASGTMMTTGASGTMMTTGATGAASTTGMSMTGTMMTTGGVRATTGANVTSTGSAVSTSTSSAMTYIPSILLVALIAMMC